MKEYQSKFPVLVIGGTSKDFLGEYMAGGIIINFNICSNDTEKIPGRMIATGIHGGSIYIRGTVEKSQLGIAADIKEFTKQDLEKITPYIEEFCLEFGYSNEVKENLINSKYTKIAPISKRPFQKLYTPDLR
jgi:glutamate synthase domain-containing protein 3